MDIKEEFDYLLKTSDENFLLRIISSDTQTHLIPITRRDVEKIRKSLIR